MANPIPFRWWVLVILWLILGGVYYPLLRELAAAGFLPAKIAWINSLLSSDTAVVIAMASLRLPLRQRLWFIILGATISVVFRIVLASVAATVMLLPLLKIIGGVALFYISTKLLVMADPDKDEHPWQAVVIIVVADMILSLDNAIAIAVAAQGDLAQLVLGLGLTIPLMVAGAALIMVLLDRFPILVWAGAALLGWIVGEVIATDPVSVGYLTNNYGAAVAHKVEYAAAAVGAVLVLVVGGLWRRSKQPAESDG